MRTVSMHIPREEPGSQLELSGLMLRSVCFTAALSGYDSNSSG
jgi:hypothetical protein